MYEYIFGWLATFCTLSYKLPQIYKFYSKKSSKGISVISLYIQGIGYIFYGIHGLIINDYPVLTMGSISFFFNIILCIQYYYYYNNDVIME